MKNSVKTFKTYYIFNYVDMSVCKIKLFQLHNTFFETYSNLKFEQTFVIWVPSVQYFFVSVFMKLTQDGGRRSERFDFWVTSCKDCDFPGDSFPSTLLLSALTLCCFCWSKRILGRAGANEKSRKSSTVVLFQVTLSIKMTHGTKF